MDCPQVTVRRADARDVGFLTEMLVEAAFWRSDDSGRGIGHVLREPDLAHYVVGWPRPGDLGMVAECDRPVGAAWLRFFNASEPGYGFVDAATPEVAMGVVKQWRELGIGGRLLDALIGAARVVGVPSLGLSVEPDNRARRLYERHGFEQVGELNGSLTMLLRL
ncbi:GNAT family N-acetyltransferase [Rhodococcus sp. NPDC058521]|uniref:GNAT family N-acetyltransferase n=1 Tax=Rhodococcus sp. NPDC058521 TaxID=3346536 RepID=UPI0036584257